MEIRDTKIAIVGSGAMGSLFGALLHEAGADVWLVDVWAEHVKVVNQMGLTVERQGKVRSVRVKATSDIEGIAKADLIVVFVKSTQTAAAAETASRLIGRDGLVVTLQNGMGNAEILAKTIDPKRIVAGTTSYGATLLGPGSIRHAGIGPTSIGMWSNGNPDHARSVSSIFNKAGIETKVVEDVRGVLWEKLLVNIGINAITALTGIKNGQLLDLDSTKQLCQAAVEEAMTVAQAQGIQISNEALEHVFRIALATGPNRSSMGQDVDHKRETEIRAINGFVVEQGRRLGIKTPVNQTLSVLIETLQAHY